MRAVAEDPASAEGWADLGLVAMEQRHNDEAAGFARNHIGLAQGVEQRGFAVVDVPHDRDHRRAGFQSFGTIILIVMWCKPSQPGTNRYGPNPFGE